MGVEEILATLKGSPSDKTDAGGAQMRGVNDYWRKLTRSQIAAGQHRGFVGGMWDEVGAMQLDFLRQQGLKPQHSVVDIGCGALRGGIHMVRYLQPGRYFGVDINQSLIDAARFELKQSGLEDRNATLLVNDGFELSRFNATFDFGISVSLFSHLYLNHISRCLTEMSRVMTPESRFYVTFFQAPAPAHLAPITHATGGITTYYDADPFHYAFSEIDDLAKPLGLAAELIGDWNHPRNQQMICFRISG